MANPVPPIVLPMDEVSQPGEARRTAVGMAERLGFDESGRGKVALVVTEIATNLIKHARGGELILQAFGPATAPDGLEALAIDRGPGMADVARCLADGFSTAGSPGTGLGAIARLAGLFEVFSQPESGTVLLGRLWPNSPPRPGGLEVAAICLPYPGESDSGDAWALVEAPGRHVLMVADGLGHGPQAAEAARAALETFLVLAPSGPAEVIRAAHAALRSTRGAAMAIAALDPGLRTLRFAGVGNISGAILVPGEGRVTSLVSHNGTVGHEMRTVQEFVYPWPERAVLVLHSDGLSTQWRPDRYPGLLTQHPGIVAGVLYRDFKRGRDDVTVLVALEPDASRS